MNDALEQRWRKNAPPFNGQTVRFDSEELTPLSALRQVLLVIVPALQECWPAANLFMLADWHEHDGYVNAAQPTTWQELLRRVGIDETTMAFTHDDWAVRMAFFPEDYGFYLRVYIPPEDDNDYPERRGDFDVTCAPELAFELLSIARLANKLPLAKIDAKEFFNRRYGG